MNQLEEYLSPEEVDDMIKSANPDKEGMIDYAHFIKSMMEELETYKQ